MPKQRRKPKLLQPNLNPNRRKKPKKAAPTESDPDLFGKGLIVVGKVLEISEVEGSDKLIQGEIDIGIGEPRHVVAGLKAFFAPEDLVNKRLLVAANLKPAKLAGILSEVMILAATGDDGSVKYITPPEGANVGERASIEGFPQLAEPAKNLNSKQWGKIVDHLHVQNEVAMFKEHKILVNGTECACHVNDGAKIK
ncbi:hypothetical protein GEMRC1_002820 [Eukaryota sp. GEM-RC1]